MLAVVTGRDRGNVPDFDVDMPGHASWRNDTRTGALLPNQIVTNHFKVDTSRKSNSAPIPSTICQYHVTINKLIVETETRHNVTNSDFTLKADQRILVAVMKQFFLNHYDEWSTIGITYDARSTVFATAALFPDANDNRLIEVIELNRDRYTVNVKFVLEMHIPASTIDWTNLQFDIIRSLDSAIVNFARMQISDVEQTWFVDGSKAFRSDAEVVRFRYNPSYISMKGYYSSFKSCMAGLVLVSDISVSAFLSGGDLISLMMQCAGATNRDAFERGLGDDRILYEWKRRWNDCFKSAKIRLKHHAFWKKIVSFEGPADTSMFEHQCNMISVANYYNETYPDFRLKYPSYPTINVGSRDRAALIPVELVTVPSGQARNSKIKGKLTAEIIIQAAIRPNDRFQLLLGNVSVPGTDIISTIRNDSAAVQFGLGNIMPRPMNTPAILLPPPVLLYGDRQIVEPGLAGEWKLLDKKLLLKPPRTAVGVKAYDFLVICVGDDTRVDNQTGGRIRNFITELQKFARRSDLQLINVEEEQCFITCRGSDQKDMDDIMRNLHTSIRIVICILDSKIDPYAKLKLIADSNGVITQCVKYGTMNPIKGGSIENIVIKMNAKMGGTSHTLAGRDPATSTSFTGMLHRAGSVFQDPPASLSWIFDRPAMLMGIDVSHPDPAAPSGTASIAAIAATMDRACTQYACRIIRQTPRQEIVDSLEESVFHLLNAFKNKNDGCLPSSIIVYRDGISEGFFNTVVHTEMGAIHGALVSLGCKKGDVKVSFIICQKRHTTRVAYYDEALKEYINPCPGICIDSSGGTESITSAIYNEFYINSHVAIQGTCKVTVQTYDTYYVTIDTY